MPPVAKLAEPPNLAALKSEVERRWGTLDLLEVLKDADFFTGFTDEFASVHTRAVTARTALRRRLLVVLFGLGTNMASSPSPPPWQTAAGTSTARPSCATSGGPTSPVTTSAVPLPA